MTDLFKFFLITSVVVVSGHLNIHSQLWVTKILSDTLDDYVPDGGAMCRRHGVEYREGLKNLKLWATQSKFYLLKLNCVVSSNCVQLEQILNTIYKQL
jgi:hypothetical protein